MSVPQSAHGTYVYGVVRPTHVGRISTVGVGEPGGDVEAVVFEDIAALVSRPPAVPVKASRRNLMTHSRVLQEAMERSTVLPIRFGVVMPSDDAVREELLEARYAELRQLLDDVEGHVEFDVKAFYREDVVLGEIVREDAQVARLRDATMNLSAEAAYYQRIALGERIANALAAKRETDADRIVRSLTRLAVATRSESDLPERMVVKAAFLVERAQVGGFDAAVERLAGTLGGRMQFKSVGPLPPYNFVELSISGNGRPRDEWS